MEICRRAALAIALWGVAAVHPVIAAPPAFRATVIATFSPRAIDIRSEEGLADQQTGRAVTAEDPVRVASISKLVTALGVMRLVEAKKLDLDTDVSTYLGWRLRNPHFPDRPLSLRLLLSHQSSLMDGGELYLIPLGETLRTRLADPRLWDAAHPAGGYFRYANINYPIIGSIIERVTGQRFDVAMDQLVIKPLGLSACYNWTLCSDAQIARAVALYDETGQPRRDDLHGQRPLCPVLATADGGCDLTRYTPGENGALFSPQGGLRISMRDLARLGQMFLQGGAGFLPRHRLRDMARPHWRFNGHNGETEGGFFCAFGLGVQTIGRGKHGCSSNGFGDGRPRIGHAGEAYGLRAGLWIDMRAKTGIAFFTSAVPDREPKGPSGFYQVEERILQSPSAQPDRSPNAFHAPVSQRTADGG